MKILLTADPELPVPPIHYGGIERIIHLLADGLVERGHDVTLIAHAQSRTRAKLIPYAATDWRSISGRIANMALVSTTIARGRHSFDLVHSHCRLAYLAPVLPLRVPTLMSYQRKVTPRSIIWSRRLSRQSIEFSAVSHDMTRDVAHLAPWHVVYNGVPLTKFDYRSSVAANAPLVFLGRIEPIKGTHVAIQAARRAGLPLVIAGNVPDDQKSYFERDIAPHVDGVMVSYIGPVDDERKNELLGKASAFLMPILWDEPFGIVMAEAMACGTPVIGFRRGSVGEVVAHGVTGFACSDEDEMVAAIARIGEIDRRACRLRAETMFSETTVVEDFLRIYRKLSHPETSGLE